MVTDGHGEGRALIEEQVVALSDVWIDIVADQIAGQVAHLLTVRKARAMAHSGRALRVTVTATGISMTDAHPDSQTLSGPSDFVTSSSAVPAPDQTAR